MSALEKDTKSILKSLTLSSAKGITVENLCRDYREIVGTSIPFKQLGYSDLMGFLKSIPDTIFISGSSMSALVIPVTDEKTAHLEEMIQKQKKPVSKSNARRRSRTIQRPRAIRINTRKNEWERPDADHNSFSKPNILPAEKIEEKCNNWDDISSDESHGINHNICPKNNESYSASFSKSNILPTKQIEEKYHNLNDISSDESHSINNHMRLSKSEFYSSSKVQNETKSRVRATNNSYNEHTASTISRKFSDPFRDKLRELISKYPNGIWCSELPQYYQKHFNEKLKEKEKGYVSVIHLCTSHSDIFHCIKPNIGDWKIFDAQRPIPNFVDDSFNNCSSVEETSIAENKDSALPAELDLTDILHFSNQNIEVMPHEILQLGEKIPRQWLQIPDDGYITVRVTEIYDPSKFWIQLYSDDCSAALDNLMNDMQDFYVLNEAYNIPTSDVQVGLYCVALIYNEWHRGVVIKIEDPYVKIFYFDYGSIGKSFMYSLKYLHKKFSLLPRQGIRARLANIRPRYPSLMWSSKATNLLLNLVNNRILVAEVLNSVEIQHHTLHLILTDTSDPNKDVHINDELKKHGFAELMTDVCKVTNDDCTETDNELFDDISINLSSEISCNDDENDHNIDDHSRVSNIESAKIVNDFSKLSVNNSSINNTSPSNNDNNNNNTEKNLSEPTSLKNEKSINTYNRNRPIKKAHYFLYPNHQDIETGIVPTIDEVAVMTANGISMDMIFKPYINSIENNKEYSYNLNDAPIKRKPYQMDFYVYKNKDVTENEEDDSCLDIDEILPETEYDSDGCSSIVTVDTLQSELPHPKTPNMELHIEKLENIEISKTKTPINEESKQINETTSREINNERVEAVIDTSSSTSPDSLNFTTNFESNGSAINVTIRPPPGFQLPKPVIPPQIDPYAIQNPYYNPYPPFPGPLAPHPAQLMHSMMYYGAAAAAAQTYMSSLMSTINVNNNTVYTNQSVNNASNTTLSSNLLNSITKQTVGMSLKKNDETSIKIQSIINDLNENLKTLLKIKENNNTEEICLLEAQINEIIRSIVTENNITTLAENLIKLIKSQIYQVVLKEQENNNKLDVNPQNRGQLTDDSVTKNNEISNQETKISKQKNQSTETREKLTDASIQVDINYEINKLNNETIETVKNNCDVEKIKNIECEKIINVDQISKENKHTVNERNYDKKEISENTDIDRVCDDRPKTCSEKLIEELNISKDETISKDNLCKKSEPKAKVELKEFGQKKIHVIKINGECYFSTLEFMLTYTRFPNVDRVKSIFTNLNIDFPSIEFNIEAHSKHSYKKLLKHRVPGCYPENPLIHLIKFKDVPIMLEKLFATNPVLVKDLQNYTNENMCK